MYFYLIGIDHKRAPIDVREGIYHDQKAIADFWMGLDPQGHAILVTCNRLEIYGVALYPDNAFGNIRRFAEHFPDFVRYAYIKYDQAQVFRHSLRLASGLESQLQGEKEILKQLDSWRNTVSSYSINNMWSSAILISKKIRSTSGLEEDSDNIASLVFDDIRKKLGGSKTYNIIVVGTGKVAEMVAKHRPLEAHIRFAAHKHYNKAKELASRAGGDPIHLKDLPAAIAGADVLICATSSPHYVINKSLLKALTADRGHPLYIYDLAVPRDVEPEIAALDGVFLQNLDDLGSIFSLYNESKRSRVDLASELIEEVLKMGVEVVHDKYL
jgi:glutamyl-tRNA reductase